MTGMPHLMPDSPSPLLRLRPQIDVLSDLLRSVRLSGSIYWKSIFSDPFAVYADENVPIVLMPGMSPRHATVFHLIAEGECFLELPQRPDVEPVKLEQGDMVLLPFGCDHILRKGEAPVVKATDLSVCSPVEEGVFHTVAMQHGGEGEHTVLVCGYVQAGDLFHRPIFRDLPALLVESTSRMPVTSMLASTVKLLLSEVERLHPGSREMLSRIMENLFIEMLRAYIGRLPAGTPGWLGALADPLVSRALQFIHAEPRRDWTVDELASSSGTSRSVLSERFKATLGQPPIQYLHNWRLQLATVALCDNSRPLVDIAADAGYESVAAFSRAFKRSLGVPPGTWRQRNLTREADLPG
jgi:AraC-like DNA-binding protein